MKKSQMRKVNHLLLFCLWYYFRMGTILVAMVLSAAGDSGFAYTSAFDVMTVQNYIWIWNVLYNSDHLCLAATLIGYRHFFSFNKIYTLQH